MGVTQMEIQNEALVLRWWWKLYTDPKSLWSAYASKLRCLNRIEGGPVICKVGGSFFWKYLLKIKSTFLWSVKWTIGNGERISFWHDHWSGLPLFEHGQGQRRPTGNRLSLKEAVPIMHNLAPHVQTPALTMEEDILIWRREGSGNYSSKSVYEAFISRGKVKWSFTHTWSLPIPPTVCLFTFLMLKGKILTHDVLERRRIACVPGCVLCTACHLETAVHLLFLCPYGVATWHECFRLKGVKFMVSGHTVQEIWRASWRFVKHEGQMTYKEWGTWFMVVCWHIWMERNSRIFRGTKLQAKELSVRIMQYAYLWLRYCGEQQRLGNVVHCRSVDAEGVG